MTAREPRDRSLRQTGDLATPDYHRVQAAPIRVGVSLTANGPVGMALDIVAANDVPTR